MDNAPERHEFISAGGHKHWIEIGKDGNGRPWATNWSGSLSVPTVMADEVLRLATRLKEAEELLEHSDIQWGGGGWKDYGSCPLCGGKVKSEGGQGHEPGCRLHFFLASGREGA